MIDRINARNRRRLLGSSMLSGLAAIVAAPSQAVAQDGDAAVDDTIIVTGTRIQRADLEAPSPVQSIGEQEFTLRNSVNVEGLLQTLPQVSPGNTNISNNPGSTTGSVDLRGLGTTRTLVLLDGRRLPSAGINPGSTSANVVDLNMIPTGLVERVDVVTGGASAVYGSDAIAGVVNFILKDDFEGIQLDTSYQFRVEDTNADTFNTSLLIGGNFADGRGNAVLHFGYTDRQGIFASQLENSRQPANPLNGGGIAQGYSEDIVAFGTFNIGSTSIPGLHTDQLIDLTGAGLASPDGMGGCGGVLGASLDTTNNICLGEVDFTGGAPSVFVPNGPGNEQYNFAGVNFAQIPQERWQIGGFTTYEVNDLLEVYARGTYSFNEVPQQLAPTPAGSSAGSFIINLNNPFLTPEMVAVLSNAVTFDPDTGVALSALGDADMNGIMDVTTTGGRRMLELGNRFRNVRRSTFQQLVGARGTIPSLEWDWDVSYSFGRTDASYQENGNIISTRYTEAANVVPDAMGNPVCASGNPACVPINIFGENNVSPAGATFIGFDAQRQQVVEQSVFLATLAGDAPAFVPWAESVPAWVFGLEYREEFGEQVGDTAIATSAITGFNGSPDISGRYDVYEVFGELQVPIVQGVQGVEDFTINAAFRYSDYSTVGGVWTYSGGFSWEPGMGTGLRIRGQYQQAVRAPNLSELFAPQANGFPSANDPCASAAGDSATCIATGVPSALVGSSLLQGNSQIETFTGGNPNLTEETAETFTIGAIWQPDFLDGLTVVVDYYDIEVTDIIASLGGGSTQNVLDACYVTLADPNSQFCQAVTRLPGGTINFVTALNDNISVATVRGIDVQVQYNLDLGDTFGTGNDLGILSFNMNGAYTLEKSFIADDVNPEVDCAGFFGTSCFNDNDPVPSWQHVLNTTYNYRAATLNARWRYIGGVDRQPSAGNRVAGIAAFNYLDISGSYDVNENVTLNAGVLNVLNKEPPFVGLSDGDNINTLESTYDILGRQIFVGASFRF